MAVEHKVARRGEDYVQEIKEILLRRFPDAEFKVYRKSRKEFRVHVTADFENLFDVLDLTSNRTTDILVDADIYIGVTPIRRGEPD